MSRRVSSRIASSHMLGRAGGGASPSLGVSAAAPASKRRRKDSSPASPHFDLKNGKHGPEHDGTKGSACVLGTPKQLVSVTSPAETHIGGSSFSASSVVMVQVPAGFSLAQAACSYGYYLVPPNRWEPCKISKDKDAGTFTRPLRFGERFANTAQCVISQVAKSANDGGGEGNVALRVDVAAELTDSDEEDIRRQVVRMFQTTFDLEPWFALSPEAEGRRYGRLFRSPTVFEDMVKSITGCNMKFEGTIRMNKLLCEEFGCNQAFPTPEDLEGVEQEDLKVKAKVGYRADRILRLAKSFRDGTVDPVWLEVPERTREEAMKFIKSLYGFGDYAAGNVVMLLGFYEDIPLDSETVRHFKDYHGVTTKNVKEVAPIAKQQYEPYAPYQYWHEMIMWHEKKRGLEVHLWDSRDFSYQ